MEVGKHCAPHNPFSAIASVMEVGKHCAPHNPTPHSCELPDGKLICLDEKFKGGLKP